MKDVSNSALFATFSMLSPISKQSKAICMKWSKKLAI